MRRQLLVFSLAAALAGCSSGEIITPCQHDPGAHAVCGFQNPEDRAPLHDRASLIVSRFGGAPMDGSTPGSLAWFDVETETTRIADPGNPDVAAADTPETDPAGEIRAAPAPRDATSAPTASTWPAAPKTLEPETLYANAGPPMSAGTIAIHLGDQLVIGS